MKKHQKPKDYTTHTSLSLKQNHIDLLKQTATDNNIPMNDLMILLLRYVNEHSLLLKKTPRVKYQKSEGDIQIVNIYIGQRDYERNMDARRYAKVSVSWLLAYAIDNFLNIVLQKILDSVAHREKILNNKVGLQTILIKKKHNRIKFVSVWYPMRT